MVPFTLDPREGELVMFSYENEDKLNSELAKLIAGTDDSKEVELTIMLPHGKKLAAFATLRRDGFCYQTTASLTALNVSTLPGMRGLRFAAPGTRIPVSKNRWNEWRFADQPEGYACPLYTSDYLIGEPTIREVVDSRPPRQQADVADIADETPATHVLWKMCPDVMEDHEGGASKRLEALLHSGKEWKPLAIALSEQIEAGRLREEEAGGTYPLSPHSITVTHGVIEMKIEYGSDNSYATQSVRGVDSQLRVQLLRREIVGADAYSKVVAAEEGNEDCVICMLPIMEGQECTVLPCAHNKNMHAFCARHTVLPDGTLRCCVCRTSVQMPTKPVFVCGFGR